MPPYLSSQEARIATKEENLNRLCQLADLLGREVDMSGSAVDIVQCVSEWEEEPAVSLEGIMHSDESRTDQNRIDDGGQLNNTDAPDDVKTVRARKCLQIIGHCLETGHPVELVLWDMYVLVPSSLATAMIQHGTAEYA